MKHEVPLSKILRGIFHFRFRFVFYQCLYFCSTKYIDSLTLTVFRMVFLGAVHEGKKAPSPLNLSDISYNDETLHSYALPKKDPKIISRDTSHEFC